MDTVSTGVDTSFCSKCICHADGSGGSGVACEVSKVGDDNCDDINNNEICDYDGGDCCTDTTTNIAKCLGPYCIAPAKEEDGVCTCNDKLVNGTKCECNIGQRLNEVTKSCEDCPLTDSDGSCVDKCPDGKGAIYGSSYGTCMPCIMYGAPYTSSDKLYCVPQCPPGEVPNVLHACESCPDGKLTSSDGSQCVEKCIEANSEKENKHKNMCGNIICLKFLVR